MFEDRICERFQKSIYGTEIGETFLWVNPLCGNYPQFTAELNSFISSVFRSCDNSIGILLRGQSGSGKTEIAKYIVQALLFGKIPPRKLGYSKNFFCPLGSQFNPFSIPKSSSKFDKYVTGILLMNYFTSASSLLPIYSVSSLERMHFNHHSSRQTTVFDIFLDSSLAVKGFRMQSVLMDESRVCRCRDVKFAPYRIIMGVLAVLYSGSEAEIADVIGFNYRLNSSHHHFIQILQYFAEPYDSTPAENPMSVKYLADELKYFKNEVKRSLLISDTLWIELMKVIISVINLISLTVVGSETSGGVISGDSLSLLETVEDLLGIKSKGTLNKYFTSRQIDGNITTTNKKQDVLRLIDGLCVELYKRAYSKLLNLCNDWECATEGSYTKKVTLIDTQGWENQYFEESGDISEDLGYNSISEFIVGWCNDKWADCFLENCVLRVESSYEKRNILLKNYISEFEYSEIFESSSGFIPSIENYSLSGNPTVNLDVFLRGLKSDKVYFKMGCNSGFVLGSKSVQQPHIFCVHHCYGEAQYDLSSLIADNKHIVLTDNLRSLFSDEGDRAIQLSIVKYDTVEPAVEEPFSPKSVSMSSRISMSRMAMKLGLSPIPLKSSDLLTKKCQFDLDYLSEYLNNSSTHWRFINCVRPNPKGDCYYIASRSLKNDNLINAIISNYWYQIKGCGVPRNEISNVAFDISYVHSQLQALQVLPYQQFVQENIFDSFLTFEEFYCMFRPILGYIPRSNLPWPVTCTIEPYPSLCVVFPYCPSRNFFDVNKWHCSCLIHELLNLEFNDDDFKDNLLVTDDGVLLRSAAMDSLLLLVLHARQRYILAVVLVQRVWRMYKRSYQLWLLKFTSVYDVDKKMLSYARISCPVIIEDEDDDDNSHDFCVASDDQRDIRYSGVHFIEAYL